MIDKQEPHSCNTQLAEFEIPFLSIVFDAFFLFSSEHIRRQVKSFSQIHALSWQTVQLLFLS
jgi:hypothetical protein